MKKVFSIIILIFSFSCNNTHNSKQETDSISYKTDTFTGPIQENKNTIEPFEPHEEGDYYVLDSIYSEKFGEIKLFKTEDKENDTVFVSIVKHNLKKIIKLTEVDFFNTSGKLSLHSFSKLLVELEIDYHTPTGNLYYSESWNRKQQILIELLYNKKIFNCTSIFEHHKRQRDDPTENKGETTELKEDSTVYRYDFQFKNDTIWLKNLSGNSKPDKKMGRYVYDKNRYVLK
jgi:hypothetical protein